MQGTDQFQVTVREVSWDVTPEPAVVPVELAVEPVVIDVPVAEMSLDTQPATHTQAALTQAVAQ
jgi:hypothetical protein